MSGASTSLSAAAPSGPRRSSPLTLERVLPLLCLAIPLCVLVAFFGIPMLGIAWSSFVNDTTGSVGISNYVLLLDSPSVWRAARNSMLVGVSATSITLVLGFLAAYGLERTQMLGKKWVGMAISLPVIAPSLVLGLGLIFLLGRNGLVGKILDIRPEIYGFWGLLIASILYALPQAILIIRAALRHGDLRQYEAAQMLGASRWRQFIDITLPGASYGVLSAAFVVFTISITDFGNAIVIGGDFSVLATEMYNQVSGQMRFGMGAVVGMLLLIPAAGAVWFERVVAKRQESRSSSTGMPFVPSPHKTLDRALGAFCALLALCMASVFAIVVVASFVHLWPYKFTFSLRHYAIDMAGGYASLWSSLGIAAATAALGVLLLFMLVVGIKRFPGRWANLAVWLAALPVAVPGLVLGLSYISVFNSATMPWGILYGTPLLVVMCNFMHYHTQGFASMMTGMRHVPVALEDAVGVLGGGLPRVMKDVYLPTLMPTLVSVGLFLFMNAMVTLSAVIFLVGPSMPLAAVTVMRLDEAGFTSKAAAFSTCIMLLVACVAALVRWLAGRAFRRT